MDTSKQFRGDNRLLLGIVLGVITFGYSRSHLLILLSHYNQHIVVTLER